MKWFNIINVTSCVAALVLEQVTPWPVEIMAVHLGFLGGLIAGLFVGAHGREESLRKHGLIR